MHLRSLKSASTDYGTAGKSQVHLIKQMKTLGKLLRFTRILTLAAADISIKLYIRLAQDNPSFLL
jgi:hypothetical protein